MSGRLSPARVALAYVVFSVLALALFAVPLWHAWRVNVGTLRVFVPEDMQALPELFHREGADAVATAVRSRSDPTGREVIVFAGPRREVLAGTLRRWPAELPDAPGTYGHVIDPGDGSMMRIVVSRVSLPGDYHLLMGRQSAGLMSLEWYFWYGMGAAMVIVLALGGGLAWQLARRANAARRSEERFRSLTELSNDFLWETDAGHRYTAIELGPAYTGVRNNAAKLGRARWEITCASPDEAAWAAHRAAIAARERFVDFRFSRVEDGEERFYEHSGEPRYDARGNFLGYRGVGRDVTARRRAEEALRESEARKSAMFEAALDCIISIDHEGRVVEFNPAAERTFGYRRAEALGKELAELIIPPRLRAQHREGLARYLKGGAGPVLGTRTEMPAVRADGNEFPVELTVTRIATRSAPLFTAYLRDITERQRAEQALRESEERYTRATAAAEAGFWDWDVVQDKYYLSPRLLEMAGLPPDTAIAGREDFQARVPLHPEDLERWKQAIKQLFASGGSRLSTELRVIVGAQTRWYRLDGMCFRDGAGKVVRWTGSSIDITARKRIEEALRESEQRYERAMLASNAGLWEWDARKDEYYCSPRHLELLGFPPGTKFSGRVDFLRRVPFHPEDLERWQQAQRQLFASGGSYLVLDLRVIGSAEPRWVRVNALCFRDSAGTVMRWTGSVTDVTEAKRAEEGLRSSEDRYALAMEAAGDGHTDWNLQTGEHYISPRLLKICGHAPGTTFRDRAEWVRRFPFHPEDRAKWERAVAAHFAGSESHFKMELRIVVRGEVRWTAFHFLSTRDAAGTPIRWTGSIGDITEQKRTEEALRLSESRYAVALETAEEGHWDWNVQTDEIFASPQAKRVMGVPEDVAYRTRGDIMSRVRYHPDDWPRISEEWRAALAGGAAEHEFVYRILHGEESRWIRGRWKVFRDAAGVALRVIGIVTDLTARKLAEDALRTSEERYSLAVEASEEGHFDVKYDTGEHFYSDHLYEIVGIAPGTRFANRAEALKQMRFYGGDAEIYLAGIRAVEARNGPERYEFEFRIVRPSGEMRWLRTRGKVRRDAEGNIRRRTGVAADITEAKLAEQALRESQERYALAVAGSDDGIWDVNFTAGRVFASARARELAGLLPGPEMVPLEEFFAGLPLHPDDVPRRTAALQAHLTGKAPAYEGEFRLRQLDGVYRWRRIHGICVRDANGRPQRMAGSFSDVDARRRAEEALRRSEARYSLAMEASEEGHFDVNLDTDEHFTSERLNEIHGFRPGMRTAKRSDFIKHVRFYGDDAEKYSAALAAAEAKDGPERYECEFRIVHPSGEVRWLRTRGKVTRDAQGRARRRTGVVADVTARRQAVETLRESEARFRALTELSSDAYWVQDENLRFLPTGSKNDLAGFPSDSHVGKTRSELSGATPLSGSWAEHEAVLQARKPFRDFEYRRLGPDGSVRYLSISGAPIFDDHGVFRGYQGVGRDITGRKRTEEEVRESEARFRGLVELSSDWYWKQDENLRFMSYVPPDVGSRSGVSAASSLGKTRWEFDNITPLSGNWEDHKAVLAARQPFRDFEYVRLDENGVPHYTVISGVPLFDVEGRFVGYHGVGRNISERRRMEDNLRESEARFRRMSELSADTYWEQDENFRYTRTGSVHDIAGYDTDVNQGKTRWEMCGEVTPLSGSWQEHQAVLAAHQPFQEFEYRRRRPDGTMGYYSASGAPMFDLQGRFTGYQGVVRDITEFRRVEEELRQSEARFRALTELSSDWYWQQDEGLRFTYLSRQGAAGLPSEIAIGKARWEFDSVRPLSGSWAEHQALLAAREPFRDLELSALAPDGSVSYVSISGAPIFDPQGNFRGYQGTGRNITERKRIEEELRSRQEMLELAQKSARVVAFEWRISAAGPSRNRWSPELAAMYGVPPEALDGSFEQWKKLIYPEDWPTVKHAIKHALRTGDVATEYRVVHPDGSVHWLQAKGRMFFDAAGKPARMLGFMQDVTQRRQAEEEYRRMEHQLRQAQRLEAMGTLAGGIAHDFNNILGAILGYGEMALRDAAKGSRLRRDLDSIVVAGERGRALVDRVLAFSRSGVADRVPVHVEKVVREALDLVSAKLPPNVTLHAKLHAGCAAMLGDSTQVHQVLMNLATNAIQAMPAGGTLRVHLDALRIDTARVAVIGRLSAADYLVLKVTDTGTGIAPEIMERIFDPFFTTKEVGTGTGLGLSLVHGIVSDLGGAIDVASSMGAGSAFTVYLPRCGDAVDPSEDEETEMPRGEGQRVLIVDDEEPLVRLATRTLEELGYAPVGFTSSTAALAAFRADPKRFDAVITDERMPGLSGAALIREVRGIHGSIPIVLMSGYVGIAIARRAREAGAEEVLKKPLSARDLAASLARVLHQ